MGGTDIGWSIAGAHMILAGQKARESKRENKGKLIKPKRQGRYRREERVTMIDIP